MGCVSAKPLADDKDRRPGHKDTVSTRSVPKSPAHQQQAFQYASPVKASGGELATGVMSLPLPQSPVAAERAVSPVSPTSRLQAVQPPFPPDVYDFLEIEALSALGVMLLCNHTPEIDCMREILSMVTENSQVCKGRSHGCPLVDMMQNLMIKALRKMSGLEPAALPSISPAIFHLKAAVQGACACCLTWSRPGWMVDLIYGSLNVYMFEEFHNQVLHVLGAINLDTSDIESLYSATAAKLCHDLLSIGEGNLLKACSLIRSDAAASALLSERTGIAQQDFLFAISHPSLASLPEIWNAHDAAMARESSVNKAGRSAEHELTETAAECGYSAPAREALETTAQAVQADQKPPLNSLEQDLKGSEVLKTRSGVNGSLNGSWDSAWLNSSSLISNKAIDGLLNTSLEEAQETKQANMETAGFVADPSDWESIADSNDILETSLQKDLAYPADSQARDQQMGSAIKQLAVIPEAAAGRLPAGVLQLLWQKSRRDTYEMLFEMQSSGKLALQQEGNKITAAEIDSVLIEQQKQLGSNEELRMWHKRLARGLLISPMLRQTSEDFDMAMEDYAGLHLAFHMAGAGELQELRALLHDESWLEGMLVGHGKAAVTDAFSRYLASVPDDNATKQQWDAVEAAADDYISSSMELSLKEAMAATCRPGAESGKSMPGTNPPEKLEIGIPDTADEHHGIKTISMDKELINVFSKLELETSAHHVGDSIWMQYASLGDTQERYPSTDITDDSLLALDTSNAAKESVAEEGSWLMHLSDDSQDALPECQISLSGPTVSQRSLSQSSSTQHASNTRSLVSSGKDGTSYLEEQTMSTSKLANVSGSPGICNGRKFDKSAVKDLIATFDGATVRRDLETGQLRLSVKSHGVEDVLSTREEAGELRVSLRSHGVASSPSASIEVATPSSTAGTDSPLSSSIIYLKTPRLNENALATQGVVFDTSGHRLVRVGKNNTRTSLDLSPSGANKKTMLSTGAIASAITSAGDRALIVDGSGRHALWDLEKGTCIMELEGVGAASDKITVSSSQSTIVVPRAGTGKVLVFDSKTGQCENELSIPKTSALRGMAVSADGQRLIAVDKHNKALVCDMTSGRLLHLSAASNRSAKIKGVASTSDGSRVLTVSRDGIARVWDVEAMACVHELKGVTKWNGGITTDKLGKVGISIAKNGHAAIWDMETGEKLHSLTAVSGEKLEGVALASDGKQIITISDKGKARVIEINPPPSCL